MRRPLLATLTSLLFLATGVFAADPPRLWIKAKCAVCHAKDGSGKTDTGRKLAVRDLRLPEIQKLTDKQLTKSITGGHDRMPSFQRQVTAADVRTLLDYIRNLPQPTKK